MVTQGSALCVSAFLIWAPFLQCLRSDYSYKSSMACEGVLGHVPYLDRPSRWYWVPSKPTVSLCSEKCDDIFPSTAGSLTVPRPPLAPQIGHQLCSVFAAACARGDCRQHWQALRSGVLDAGGPPSPAYPVPSPPA